MVLEKWRVGGNTQWFVKILLQNDTSLPLRFHWPKPFMGHRINLPAGLDLVGKDTNIMTVMWWSLLSTFNDRAIQTKAAQMVVIPLAQNSA